MMRGAPESTVESPTLAFLHKTLLFRLAVSLLLIPDMRQLARRSVE